MSSRPTFNAAKATETQGGYKRYVPSHTQSVYLMPSHTVLKTRQIGQGNEEEIKHKDLKKELQEREQLVQKKKNNQSSTIIPAIEEEKNKDIIEEIVEEETEEFTKVPKSNYDDSDDDLNTSSDDSDSDGDSDNDELIKELERVKRAKEEKERLATQERALTSNPLLKPISSKKDDDDEDSFTVKRKWTDSTIFKNQANDSNQQKKKRFINDTTRNDNHKQFMYEYMK